LAVFRVASKLAAWAGYHLATRAALSMGIISNKMTAADQRNHLYFIFVQRGLDIRDAQPIDS
jgi:hypothetical protein